MAQDANFCKFIKRKKDAYDKGADITAPALMEMAENKYKTCFLTG
jgi:hypothetical protein